MREIIAKLISLSLYYVVCVYIYIYIYICILLKYMTSVSSVAQSV